MTSLRVIMLMGTYIPKPSILTVSYGESLKRIMKTDNCNQTLFMWMADRKEFTKVIIRTGRLNQKSIMSRDKRREI